MSPQAIIGLLIEGVPIAAVARAVGMSSSKIYEMVADARDAGTLQISPKYDWPKGERIPCYQRPRVHEFDHLIVPLCSRLGIAPQEASVLALLLLKGHMAKTVIHEIAMPGRDPKQLDVVVHKLRRKLGEHTIETVWGIGLRIPDDVRRELLDRINVTVAAPKLPRQGLTWLQQAYLRQQEEAQREKKREPRSKPIKRKKTLPVATKKVGRKRKGS